MGVVMDTKNGGMALKIEQVPVGWDGWAYLNEPRPRDGQQGGGNAPDDDIPW